VDNTSIHLHTRDYRLSGSYSAELFSIILSLSPLPQLLQKKKKQENYVLAKTFQTYLKVELNEIEGNIEKSKLFLSLYVPTNAPSLL
jgi:hypothetical protein